MKAVFIYTLFQRSRFILKRALYYSGPYFFWSTRFPKIDFNTGFVGLFNLKAGSCSGFHVSKKERLNL
ncbi:MAG: hypothetical protein JWM28_2063 [Chitinophagaceae bacterium]|nr:hypothetical protein [Chitinophagaceae bacterium]